MKTNIKTMNVDCEHFIVEIKFTLDVIEEYV